MIPNIKIEISKSSFSYEMSLENARSYGAIMFKTRKSLIFFYIKTFLEKQMEILKNISNKLPSGMYFKAWCEYLLLTE